MFCWSILIKNETTKYILHCVLIFCQNNRRLKQRETSPDFKNFLRVKQSHFTLSALRIKVILLVASLCKMDEKSRENPKQITTPKTNQTEAKP